MKMNGPKKSVPVLVNMNEEETETLGNSMLTLGEIDTPVIDSVSGGFYDLVEAGSNKLNTEGMVF
jgi:hypothetical protein